MTAALVAVFGSELVTKGAGDVDRSIRPLLQAVTGLPAWAVGGDGLAVPGWALAAKLVTLLVAVAILTRIVGSAGSRTSAFVAGWGAVVLSGALAAVASLQLSALLLGGPAEPANGVPATVRAIDTGATFGLYTGWLVGLVVAVTMTPARHPVRPKPPSGKPAPRTKTAAPAPPSGATWPPRPRIGTALPNPAWTAAGLHQEPNCRPRADASAGAGAGANAP